MAAYRHILFAADLQPHDDSPVADRVEQMVAESGAKLSLIHVIEQLTYSYGEPFVSANYLEWQSELEETAKTNLKKYAERFSVPEERQYLPTGRPQDLILAVAKKADVDLIILGSHGRSGIAKLVLGSTANGVLQGAHCDVLAVRFSENDG
jgi:universal stress protein A